MTGGDKSMSNLFLQALVTQCQLRSKVLVNHLNNRKQQVEVKLTLHGILRDYLPRQAKGRTTLNLSNGSTVDAVAEQLKIKQNVTAAVNGVEVENDHILQDGEELHLFRFIAGG